MRAQEIINGRGYTRAPTSCVLGPPSGPVRAIDIIDGMGRYTGTNIDAVGAAQGPSEGQRAVKVVRDTRKPTSCVLGPPSGPVRAIDIIDGTGGCEDTNIDAVGASEGHLGGGRGAMLGLTGLTGSRALAFGLVPWPLPFYPARARGGRVCLWVAHPAF